jgi:hypothetical protein
VIVSIFDPALILKVVARGQPPIPDRDAKHLLKACFESFRKAPLVAFFKAPLMVVFKAPLMAFF